MPKCCGADRLEAKSKFCWFPVKGILEAKPSAKNDKIVTEQTALAKVRHKDILS